MNRVAHNEEVAFKKQMQDLDRSFDELKQLSEFTEGLSLAPSLEVSLLAPHGRLFPPP